MAKKFYVVWVGHKTGIFTSWSEAKEQVDRYPKAKFKSFKTHKEAEAAFAAGSASATNGAKDSLSRKNEKATEPLGVTSEKHFNVRIYCDGACDPNPGEAGSGVALYRENSLEGLWYGLYNPQGSNNSAELNALFQALHFASEEIGKGKEVQILCDSKYSINCVTNWAFSWEKKGWKRKTDGDIKNLDIIQQAHMLFRGIKDDVDVSHVAAHMGIEGNELADRMAAFGIGQQETEFCRYSDPLDVHAILEFKSG